MEQEEVLSPKHARNAIMKRIKEDIIQVPPEEVMRAQFAVDFELSLPLSSCTPPK